MIIAGEVFMTGKQLVELLKTEPKIVVHSVRTDTLKIKLLGDIFEKALAEGSKNAVMLLKTIIKARHILNDRD